MIGQKIAKSSNVRVTCTLEIPDDAVTDLNRADIVDKEMATQRASKVKVVHIEDAEGQAQDSAVSGFQYPKLTQTVGEEVVDPRWGTSPGAGIYFFVSRYRADLFEIKNPNDGLRESWHPNGQKAEEITYQNGMIHGTMMKQQSNGTLRDQREQVDNTPHGLHKGWWENGQLWQEANQENGKNVGFERTQQTNGELYQEKKWGADGILESQTIQQPN